MLVHDALCALTRVAIAELVHLADELVAVVLQPPLLRLRGPSDLHLQLSFKN